MTIGRTVRIAAAVVLVVMFAIWQIQVANLRADVATEKTNVETQKAETVAAQKDLSDLNAMIAQRLASNEAKRAEDERAERLRQAELQRRADELRGQRDRAIAERNAKQDELREALRNALPQDTAPLSPSIVRYLDGLRLLQRSPGDNDRAAPP